MANPWFRLYSEFSSDPKVQSMSEAMQRRLIMLLCLRCSNEHVTLHDDEIAFHWRISVDELGETKALFMRKGFIDNDWNVVNWDKRQFASDSSVERVRKHREKKKQHEKHACNVTVTPPDTDTELTTDTDVSVVASKPATIDDCPHQAIIALYAEILPELPQPRIWDGARAKSLTARWRWVLADLKSKGKPAERADGIDFFRRMFGYIRDSDFLMGRAGRWSADLGWIVKAEPFAKILQGNYENKQEAA